MNVISIQGYTMGVPDTAEGWRYAGYLVRYKLGHSAINAPGADSVPPARLAAYQAGFYQYPDQPAIPVGFRRATNDAWSRYNGTEWLPTL